MTNICFRIIIRNSVMNVSGFLDICFVLVLATFDNCSAPVIDFFKFHLAPPSLAAGAGKPTTHEWAIGDMHRWFPHLSWNTCSPPLNINEIHHRPAVLFSLHVLPSQKTYLAPRNDSKTVSAFKHREPCLRPSPWPSKGAPCACATARARMGGAYAAM